MDTDVVASDNQDIWLAGLLRPVGVASAVVNIIRKSAMTDRLMIRFPNALTLPPFQDNEPISEFPIERRVEEMDLVGRIIPLDGTGERLATIYIPLAEIEIFVSDTERGALVQGVLDTGADADLSIER